MIKKTFTFVIVTLALLGFCSCVPKEKESQRLILAENLVPLSSITIIAQINGYFVDNGLDVETVTFSSGKAALDAVLGGSADYATVAETPIMFAGARSLPVRVLGTFTSSPDDCKLVVNTIKGIEDPKDLKGKKIAALQGTSSHYFLSKFLSENGLSFSDIEFLSMRPTEMPAAFSRGDIDGYAMWEPHASRGMKSIGSDATFFSGASFYTETFNIAFVGDSETLNDEVHVKFLRALLDAQNFINTEKEEAIRIVAKKTGMEIEELSDIWENYDFKVEIMPGFEDLLSSQYEWAVSEKIIQKASQVDIDFSQLMYRNPLNTVSN